MFGYSLFALSHAVTLTPPVDQPRYFAPGHMYNRMIAHMDETFAGKSISRYDQLEIMWGLDDLDRSEFDPYVPGENRGTVSFRSKDQFSIYAQESVDHILRACRQFRDEPCRDEVACERTHLAESEDGTPLLTIQEESHQCFLEEFFALHNVNATNYMQRWQNETDFESDLFAFRASSIPMNEPEQNWKNRIGFVDGKVRFVSIVARITLTNGRPHSVKVAAYEKSDAFNSRLNDNTPSTLGSSVHVTGFNWGWMDVERLFYMSLVEGLLLALPVSFVVLLVATGNWITASTAIFTIFCIIANVLGLMKYFYNYSLGIVEVMCGILTVGLSIDYTIHVGHMLGEARLVGIADRSRRAQYALEKMGGTVLAAMFTTFASGIPGQMAVFSFFPKIGQLVMLTVLISFFFTLGFFVSAMILWGPSRDQGQIPFIGGAAGVRKDTGEAGFFVPKSPVLSRQQSKESRPRSKTSSGAYSV